MHVGASINTIHIGLSLLSFIKSFFFSEDSYACLGLGKTLTFILGVIFRMYCLQLFPTRAVAKLANAWLQLIPPWLLISARSSHFKFVTVQCTTYIYTPSLSYIHMQSQQYSPICMATRLLQCGESPKRRRLE